jgi:hypothetical protein
MGTTWSVILLSLSYGSSFVPGPYEIKQFHDIQFSPIVWPKDLDVGNRSTLVSTLDLGNEPRCQGLYGSGALARLSQSRHNVCAHGVSQCHLWSYILPQAPYKGRIINMAFYDMQNVSVTKMDPVLQLLTECNRDPVELIDKTGALARAVQNAWHTASNLTCRHWIEEPIVLAPTPVFHNLCHGTEYAVTIYLMLALIQQHIDLSNVKLLFPKTLRNPMALEEMYYLLLPGHHRSVKALWFDQLQPGTCFRRIFWQPGKYRILGSPSPNVAINCSHAIAQAYVMNLRAEIGLPLFPAKPARPRVAYMARDLQKDRHTTNRLLSNQEEVIAFLHRKLRHENLELDVLRFYHHEGQPIPSFSEQAKQLSASNILIGMHGAGITWEQMLPEGSFTIYYVHRAEMAYWREHRLTVGEYYRNYAAAFGQGFVFAYVMQAKKVHLEPLWEVVQDVVARWIQVNHGG